jgi:drug/metabolite transporter (DMT)-like permease
MTRHNLLLLFSIWAFATSPIWIRFSNLEASFLVGVRMGITLVFFFPFWFRRKENRKVFFSRSFLISGMMLGAHFILWTLSLEYTSVSSASVAVTSSPIFVVILTRLILKKPLPKQTYGALGFALTGALILLWNDLQHQSHSMWGILIALIAAFLFAIYILIGEKARKTHSLLQYVFPVYVVAAIVSFATAWVQGIAPWSIFSMDWREWGILMGLALFPTMLGHTSMNFLVKHLRASTLTITGLSIPFFSTLFAIPFLKEYPSTLGVTGGVITLFGVFLLIRRKKVQD